VYPNDGTLPCSQRARGPVNLGQQQRPLSRNSEIGMGGPRRTETDGRKKQQERDFGVDETSKDSFSDDQGLECLAKAFGNR
jgi:hypothetical protein